MLRIEPEHDADVAVVAEEATGVAEEVNAVSELLGGGAHMALDLLSSPRVDDLLWRAAKGLTNLRERRIRGGVNPGFRVLINGGDARGHVVWNAAWRLKSVNLGSVATITRGASVRAAELDALACEEDTGISYLNLGNISDGGIDDELPNLSSLDPKLEKYCIRDGNVLISKSGAPFKVAVAEVPEGRKVLANDNLYVLEVDRDKIDPHYLAAFFLSPAGKELLAREAVGTAIPNVPIRALSAIKVPLLDADRQKAIANAYLAKTDEIKVLKLRLEKARGEIADLFDEEG